MKYTKTIIVATFAAVMLSGFALRSEKSGTYTAEVKIENDTLKVATVDTVVVDELESDEKYVYVPFKKNAHASYYHDKFNGKKTASGQRFSNKKYTAAHKTFPFGTMLRLTNETNGKSVLVEVTDRGPFSASREIDITKKAFDELSGRGKGSVDVTIEIAEEK